jgi:transcriptional regulator with XRE-family HTH domain
MKEKADFSQLPDRLEFVKGRFGLTNSQLGGFAGVSSTTITYILSGKTSKPRTDILKAIAKELSISYKWLASGEGNVDDLNESIAASPESAAFAQDTVDRIIGELKAQYETRLSELKAQYESRIAELKDQTGDLREQLKFNREMVQAFKEGHLGKSEGAIIRPLHIAARA